MVGCLDPSLAALQIIQSEGGSGLRVPGLSYHGVRRTSYSKSRSRATRGS